MKKRHSDVLEKIESLIKEMNSTENSVQYFILNNYKDDSGKSNKEYLLTRDGFSLLVMGFTGTKALKWKLKYIEAFNKMEEYIKSNPTVLPTTFKEALQQLLVEVEEKDEDLETFCDLQVYCTECSKKRHLERLKQNKKS